MSVRLAPVEPNDLASGASRAKASGGRPRNEGDDSTDSTLAKVHVATRRTIPASKRLDLTGVRDSFIKNDGVAIDSTTSRLACLSRAQVARNCEPQGVWPGRHRGVSKIGKLAAEVLALDPGQPIPSVLLETNDINDVARAVVARIRREEKQLPLGSSKEADLMKDTEMVLFFHPAVLDAVAKQGFLNVHQTGASSGATRSDARQELEDALFGLGLGGSPQALQLRPKFAALNLRVPFETISAKPCALDDQYGGIAAVLENEVKDRSTWTTSDSSEIAVNATSPEQVRQHTGTFFRGAFPLDTVYRFLFYEAQVLGELTLNDVSHFLVRDPAEVARLRRFNKPIYRMERQRRMGRDVYGHSNLEPPLWMPSGVDRRCENAQRWHRRLAR